MTRRPWQASAIIWAAGVVLVGLVVTLLSYGGGKRVDWAEVTALALVIPSVGIVGVAWGSTRDGSSTFATASCSPSTCVHWAPSQWTTPALPLTPPNTQRPRTPRPTFSSGGTTGYKPLPRDRAGQAAPAPTAAA
jgi:hypothetical protein